jgi:glycosyltransferase involved in cell wall biosynthesis
LAHSPEILTRLASAAPYFGVNEDELSDLRKRGAGPLLSELAIRAKDSGRELAWLLVVTLTATFPSPSEFRRMFRRLSLTENDLAHRVFLEAGWRNPAGFTLPGVQIAIVSDSVVVDVNFCAKHGHNTGIQRVVRQTMARWKKREVLPVAWTDGNEAMRQLSQLENERVVDFSASQAAERTAESAARSDSDSDSGQTLVVIPFRTTVILLEVPEAGLCQQLAALAEFSGNRVGVVGYDTIPIVSAETVPPAETNRFVNYLSVVKFARRVAGISSTAAEEFAGFAHAVEAQGLIGPEAVAVPLPVDLPDVALLPSDRPTGTPVVLCVGSHEPRKNHGSVLFAAETLWREGLKFSLRFIGGGSYWFTRRFDEQVRRLARKGRDIRVFRGVDDQTMLRNYQEASFTVFPSLHEGYGLPVAESLALGTPVITTNYGSTAEIVAAGGCIAVDPRDDTSITAAMRQLLTDHALLESLRGQIAARPARTWDDYAEELWSQLVVPLRGH